MPQLMLGPVLRHVGPSHATVWVETDAACEVEVLGAATRTFQVEGCHYALVIVEGLDPGTTMPYEVLLDGERAWPEGDSPFPPSVIRTLRPGESLEIVFGSCRVAVPHRPPFTQDDDGPERSRGIDALRAFARRMARAGDPGAWPDALLMLGDQIYADDLSPALVEATSSLPEDPDHPDDELGDFGDYVLAYREAWGEPLIRWLLSVLPSTMVFDDHEIHAEWKISQAWVEAMRRRSWYDDRISAGLSAYWVYQHLGNLSPRALRDSELLAEVLAEEDGGPVLREHARTADRQTGHSRWSFCRDFGRTRLVVIDSRAGRVLTPGGRRMIDDGEWRWLEEQVTGDFDHLLLASSVPFFLTTSLHDLEAWNEAVCDGAWGTFMARAGERLRQALVLDHWAAFQTSFHRLARLLEEIATGARGAPPQSVVLLSGDVHHCYLAEVGFRRGDDPPPRAPVWQAVCSPYRKELAPHERRAMRFGSTRAARAIGRLLMRSARLERPPLGWRVIEQPGHDNQVATLTVGPGTASVRFETSVGSSWRAPELFEMFRHDLLG